MQITLTLELTAENLEKMKVFCEETGAAPAKQEKKQVAKSTVMKKDVKPEPETKEPELEAQAAQEAKAEEPKEEQKKALTITDVRAVALKLSKAGKSDLLKEIFAKFGATKLSEVPAEKYEELMAELAAVNG